MTTQPEQLSDAKRALLQKWRQGKRPTDTTEVATPTIPRRPDGDTVPLSFTQQRMWFLYQLNPDSSAYNMAQGILLQGDLDRSALQNALDAIVRRHATL